MVARMTVYENVDLDLVERINDWMRGPGATAFDGLPGYHGSMTLLDRDNARLIGIGYYESAGAAREAEAVLEDLFARIPEDVPAYIREAASMPVDSVALYDVVQRD